MAILTNRLALVGAACLLTACATTQDVQRASDLIRSDNELTRLLVEVRPGDHAGVAPYINGLAAYAHGEGDAIRGTERAEAIAYYRIAATAYWRSGDPSVADSLFAVAMNGKEVCGELGANAPDRDCLFLQLVIPFAAVEDELKRSDISATLDKVDFNDEFASDEDINNVQAVRDSLTRLKPVIQSIQSAGSDQRLINHPSMCDYYQVNATAAFRDYDAYAALLGLKVGEFLTKIDPSGRPDLGLTVDSAAELRSLDLTVPPCPDAEKG